MKERHGHSLKQELIVGFGVFAVAGVIVGGTFLAEDDGKDTLDAKNQRNSSGTECLWNANKAAYVCPPITIPRECVDWAVKTLEKNHGMEISNPSTPDERPLTCGQEKESYYP